MDPIKPVFSALDAEDFKPSQSPRTYKIAPLSYRERNRLRRMVRDVVGETPERDLMLGVLRECLQQIQPANLAEALSHVDEAMASPDDKGAQARLAVLERAVRHIPAYAELIDAQQRANEEEPWVIARFVLRGWSGPGLPDFMRVDGLVPEDILDAVPAAELDAIRTQARYLMWVGPSAVGNSEPPTPSPEPPTPTPAD